MDMSQFQKNPQGQDSLPTRQNDFHQIFHLSSFTQTNIFSASEAHCKPDSLSKSTSTWDVVATKGPPEGLIKRKDVLKQLEWEPAAKKLKKNTENIIKGKEQEQMDCIKNQSSLYCKSVNWRGICLEYGTF